MGPLSTLLSPAVFFGYVTNCFSLCELFKCTSHFTDNWTIDKRPVN